MTDTARWAIYYAPERGDALWERGVSWLGRDPEDGREFAHPTEQLDAQDWERLTATPRRYGWHATLKPPMHLHEAGMEDVLRRRLRAFTAKRAPFMLPKLLVRRLGDFLALTLQTDCTDLRSLAEDCVREFDDLRAPPSEAELRQRRSADLSPRQDALLARWGYPYVFEEFRFHLTLTGKLPPDRTERLLGVLEDWFATALVVPQRVTELALYRQAGPNQDFILHERFPFGDSP